MKNAREISIIEVFNSKYQNIYLSGKNCEDIQFVMWKEVSLGRKRVDRSYQILSGTKFCPSSYSMTFTLICKTNTTAAGNTSWPNIKKTGKKKKQGCTIFTHLFLLRKRSSRNAFSCRFSCQFHRPGLYHCAHALAAREAGREWARDVQARERLALALRINHAVRWRGPMQ